MRRAISFALCLVFFLGNTVLSHSTEANIWKERRKNQLVLAQLPTTNSLSLQPSFTPIQSSAVRALAEHPKNKRVVFHIQDVHQNEEAQAHISQTLSQLIQERQIDMVALEGAFENLDLESIREFPFPDSIRQVAGEMLKENKISGPAQAGLASEQPIPPFIGIDDKSLYNANVKAVQESHHSQRATQKHIRDLIQKNEEGKQTSLSPQLKDLDAQILRYQRNQISIGEHLLTLVEKTQVISPEIRKFTDALRLEKNLSFEKSDVERTHLLTRLSQRLDKKASEALLATSNAFRLGRINQADFYSFLKDLSESNHISLSSFPHFSAYINYVDLSDKIQAETLLSETKKLESSLYKKFTQTKEERDLIEESKFLALAEKLTEFSLTADEWKEFKTFAQRPWTMDHKQLLPFEQFYRHAEARDTAMAKNLMGAMAQYKSNVAVLVTGGFHSKGIQQELEKHGIQTLPFTPKITKIAVGDHTIYLNSFTQEKTPLDKLFEGEKLFLAKSPFPNTARIELIHRAAVPLLQRGKLSFAVFKNWIARAVPNLSALSYRNQNGAITLDEQWAYANGREQRLSVRMKELLYEVAIAGFAEKKDDLKKDFTNRHPSWKNREQLLNNQRALYLLSDASFGLSFLSMGWMAWIHLGPLSLVAIPFILKASDLITLHLTKPIWHNTINIFRVFILKGSTSARRAYRDPHHPKHLTSFIKNRQTAQQARQFQTVFSPFWTENIKNSHEMILEGARKSPRHKTVTILGCGQGWEIPINELAEMFDVINLVDIDETAMDALIQSAPDNLRPKFRKHVMDLTGGAIEEIVTRALEILKNEDNANDAYWRMRQLSVQFPLDFSHPKFGHLNADYVISSLVMTQFTAIGGAIVNKAFKEKFGVNPPTSIFSVGFNQETYRHHADLIQHLLDKDGIAYLAVDRKLKGNVEKVADDNFEPFLNDLLSFLTNSEWSKNIPPNLISDFSDFKNHFKRNEWAIISFLLQLIIAQDRVSLRDYSSNPRLAKFIVKIQGVQLSPEQILELVAKIRSLTDLYAPESDVVQIKEDINQLTPPELEHMGDLKTWAWVPDPIKLFSYEIQGALFKKKSTQGEKTWNKIRTSIYDPFFEKGKKFPYNEPSLSEVREDNWGVSVRDRFVQADGSVSTFYSLSALAYVPEESSLSENLFRTQSDFQTLPFAAKFKPTPTRAFHLTMAPIIDPRNTPFVQNEIEAAKTKTQKLASDLSPFRIYVNGLTIDPASGRIMAQVYSYPDETPRRRTITLLTPFQQLTPDEKEQLITWVEKHRTQPFGYLEVNRADLVHTLDSFGITKTDVFSYPLLGQKKHPQLISKSLIPTSAKSLEDIFGRNIRTWFENQSRTWKETETKEKAEALAVDADFWAYAEKSTDDFGLALIQYMVDRNMDIGTLSLKSFLLELKKAAPSEKKKMVPIILLPLRTFLHLRLSLSDTRVKSLIEEDDFQSSEPEERMGLLVTAMKNNFALPIESENLGQLYTGLPLFLPGQFEKRKISKPDVSLKDFATIREALKDPNVQEEIEQDRFKKLTPPNKLPALIHIFKLFGYNIETDSFAQIHSALPKRISKSVKKSDIHKIESSRTLFAAFRSALKSTQLKPFLTGDVFKYQTASEDKMVALVKEIKAHFPDINTDNLDHLHSLLPDELPGGVKKEDVQKVMVTLTQWEHARKLLRQDPIKTRTDEKFKELLAARQGNAGPDSVGLALSEWLLKNIFKDDPLLSRLKPMKLLSALPHDLKKNGNSNGKHKTSPQGFALLPQLLLSLLLFFVPMNIYALIDSPMEANYQRIHQESDQKGLTSNSKYTNEAHQLLALQKPASLDLATAFNPKAGRATIVHVNNEMELNDLEVILAHKKSAIVVIGSPDIMGDISTMVQSQGTRGKVAALSLSDLSMNIGENLYSYDEVLNHPSVRNLKDIEYLRETLFSEGQLTVVARNPVPFKASEALAKIISVLLRNDNGWIEIGLETFLQSMLQTKKSA